MMLGRKAFDTVSKVMKVTKQCPHYVYCAT